MKFTLVCVLEKCEKDGGRDGEGAKFCHIGNLGVIYSNSEKVFGRRKYRKISERRLFLSHLFKDVGYSVEGRR